MNSNKRSKRKRTPSLRNLQTLLILAVFVSFCGFVLIQNALLQSAETNVVPVDEPPFEIGVSAVNGNGENVSPLSFPPDCTWQCYIRQNEDLLQKLPWNEAAAIQHYQRYGVHKSLNCAYKVLILAGPHKTASSSLQNIAITFSNMDNIQWHWLFQHQKGFAPFVQIFYGMEMIPNPFIGRKVPSFDTLRKHARYEIQAKYNQGYNIILGSEEIDYITTNNDPSPKNNTIIDEIINILPKTSREYKHKHLSSLVVYRAPRSSHLKSLWVQLQNKSRNNHLPILSFKHFICNAKDGLEKNFRKVDSLAMTKIMLRNNGIGVKLFDMTTSLDEDNNNGKSLTSMLGCDVMGLSCITDEESNQIIPVAIDQYVMKKDIMERLMKPQNRGSVKQGFNSTDQLKMFDISNEQFLQIDESLNRYDCAQYADMMKYDDKLELLFYNDKSILNDNMMKCKHYPDLFITSHDQVVQSIKAIVGCDDED